VRLPTITRLRNDPNAYCRYPRRCLSAPSTLVVAFGSWVYPPYSSARGCDDPRTFFRGLRRLLSFRGFDISYFLRFCEVLASVRVFTFSEAARYPIAPPEYELVLASDATRSAPFRRFVTPVPPHQRREEALIDFTGSLCGVGVSFLGRSDCAVAFFGPITSVAPRSQPGRSWI